MHDHYGRLASSLKERGPEQEWTVEQLRGQRSVSDEVLDGIHNSWVSYQNGLELTGKLQAADGHLQGEPPVALHEAQALLDLNAYGTADETRALSEVLSKRNPAAKYIATKLLSNSREFADGQVGADQLIALTDAAAPYVAARGLLDSLGRQSSSTAKPEDSLSLPDANAIVALRDVSPVEQKQLSVLLSERGPTAERVSYLIDRNWRRSDGEITTDDLGKLHDQAVPYADAKKELARVVHDATRQDSDKSESVTASEITAGRTLKQLDQTEDADKMADILSKRGAGSAWLAGKLIAEPTYINGKTAVTDEQLQNLLAARAIFNQTVPESGTTGSHTFSATKPVSLDEAKAVVTLRQVQGDEDSRLATVLSVRSPAAEWSVSKLQRMKIEDITPQALADLVTEAKPLEDSRALLSRLEQAKSSGAPVAPDAISLEEIQALHTFFQTDRQLGTKDESKLKAILSERGPVAKEMVRRSSRVNSPEALAALHEKSETYVGANKLLNELEEMTPEERKLFNSDQPLSLEHARYIHSLKNPYDKSETAGRLADLLGERGPGVHKVARSLVLSSDEVTEKHLQYLSRIAKPYVFARSVLDQTRADSGQPLADDAPPITLDQAQALINLHADRVVQRESGKARQELSDLIGQHSPLAKAVVEVINYRKSSEGAISQYELDHIIEEQSEKLQADGVLARAKEESENEPSGGSRSKLVSADEARAVINFRERSRYQAEPLEQLLSERSEETKYVVEKLPQRGSVSEDGLAQLNAQAHDFVQGKAVLERLEGQTAEERQSADDTKPLTVEEAQAIGLLSGSSSVHLHSLMQIYSERGPATEWVSQFLRDRGGPLYSHDQTVAQSRLDDAYSQVDHALQARAIHSALRQSDDGPDAVRSASEASGTSDVNKPTAPDQVNLEEASAIANFNQEGRHETARNLGSIIGKRGVRSQYIADELNKEYANRVADPDGKARLRQLQPSRLQELSSLAERYAAAREVIDNVAPSSAEAISLDEANALHTLRAVGRSSEQDDYIARLYQKHLPPADPEDTRWRPPDKDSAKKADATHWIGETIQNLPSIFDGDKITADDLAKLHEARQLQVEMQGMRSKFNPAMLRFKAGITDVRDVSILTDFWSTAVQDRPDDKPEYLGPANQIAHLPIVGELPADQLRSIWEHTSATSQYELWRGDKTELSTAAKGWQLDATFPKDLAQQVAQMEPSKQLAAVVAWHNTLAQLGDPQASDLASPPLSNQAEQIFRQQFEDVSAQGRSTIVNQLTDKRALPAAVATVHGRTLDAEQQGAMVKALRGVDEPYKVLLGVKSGAFSDTLAALKQVPDKDSPDYEEEPHGYNKETAALALAVNFKGASLDWLNERLKFDRAMAKSDEYARAKIEDRPPEEVHASVSRSRHDATSLLPIQPPDDVKGLGQFLLKNSNRSAREIGVIARNWSGLDTETRGLPFKSMLETIRAARYPESKDVSFAAEAAYWGVRDSSYEKYEARYLASQKVPSQFPLDRSWTKDNLTGRFLPRNDPRGVFLGEHTACCQHPAGQGDSSAWHGMEDPNGGFFVVENTRGKIVAQSWTWVSDSGGLVFDNVEAKGIGAQQGAVGDIYQQAADDLSQKFHTITLGKAYSDKLDLSRWRSAARLTQPKRSDYRGYTDAHSQVLLAHNPSAVFTQNSESTEGSETSDEH